jgi:hypothetical protein
MPRRLRRTGEGSHRGETCLTPYIRNEFCYLNEDSVKHYGENTSV